ncbi:hypothetical protein J6K35_05930 [bacterium]|nr:hypothetical protein [bacterium]
MNVAPINTQQVRNSSILNSTKSKKYEGIDTNLHRNISFGWECRGGYYSTPRGGCASSFIGVLIGVATALLAAPAGLFASTIAVTGGGIIGGTAGKIIGGKLESNKNNKEKRIVDTKLNINETDKTSKP